MELYVQERGRRSYLRLSAAFRIAARQGNSRVVQKSRVPR